MTFTIMRNHVIPQFIIKRFADDSGRIWFYRKPKWNKEPNIGRVGYGGIFIRKGIYDDKTEDWLQKLDGKMAGIVNRIEQKGPQDVVLPVSDKLSLCEFLTIQLLRSEKSIHNMTCDEYIDGYVRETYKIPRPSREEFHKEVLRYIRYMIDGGTRNWVNPVRPQSGQLTFVDIYIIAIPDTLDASFVVGDSVPILYSRRPSPIDSPYRNELVNPNSIKVMPINPKNAIILGKVSVFEDVRAAELVEAINITMFNECLAIAAYEKDIIQSLLSSSHTTKTHEKTLEMPPTGFCLNG